MAAEGAPAVSEAFARHLAREFGPAWRGLLDALARPASHAALANPFAEPESVRAALEAQQAAPLELSQALGGMCFAASAAGPPLRGAERKGDALSPFYLLDAASLLPVLALDPRPGDSVLDVCAAPGGKTLAIAFLVARRAGLAAPKAAAEETAAAKAREEEEEEAEEEGEEEEEEEEDGEALESGQAAEEPHDGEDAAEDSQDDGDDLLATDSARRPLRLVANDASRVRTQRLRKVLQEFLPLRVRAMISTTAEDATRQRWRATHRGRFDRVLLDAPCSSDRHVVHDAAAMAEWSSKRPKLMAERQLALLRNAFAALRPGGRLVYSTCALAHEENDGVVARFLERRSDAGQRARGRKKRASESEPPARSVPLRDLPFGRPTELGWLARPDECGWGPIFLAVLERPRAARLSRA